MLNRHFAITYSSTASYGANSSIPTANRSSTATHGSARQRPRSVYGSRFSDVSLRPLRNGSHVNGELILLHPSSMFPLIFKPRLLQVSL